MRGSYVPLREAHLGKCVGSLPVAVREVLAAHPGELVVAGGLLRSVEASSEVIRDVDMFVRDARLRDAVLGDLAKKIGVDDPLQEILRCTTLRARDLPLLQVEVRDFEDVPELLDKIDFTVCQAALYYEQRGWAGICHPRFYEDVAARRLRYTSPDREEDPADSLMRTLKFYRRGYRAGAEDLALVLSRFVDGDERYEDEFVQAIRDYRSPFDGSARVIVGD